MRWRFIPILGLGVLGGCSHNVAEWTDRTIVDIARQPYDREPKDPSRLSEPLSADPAIARSLNGGSKNNAVPAVAKDIQTASYLNAEVPKGIVDPLLLKIPRGIPGSEVPEIRKPATDEEIPREVKRLYPPLPALPDEPKPLPKSDGTAYTLSELQEIAALNSPDLKQAASDVRAAEGALIQARTYANPTVAYQFQPSNDGSTAGVHGILADQKINTAGKLGLRRAAAQKDYDNAELALKKARSDLATRVRNAYFGLLVAKETVRVNRALSVLTDEVYLTQIDLAKNKLTALYEPAPLRAQANLARVALQQSIWNYHFAWKQVVSMIGMRQLPLTDVSGRIDSYIPYYDYDTVLARVLANHTDILIARNGIEKARYNLKLQQVTPVSDVDFQFYVGKETSLAPFQWVAQGQVGFTLPIWDQNRGNIISAEAAIIRALEQPHTAELNLANNLQNAYGLYQNSLLAIESYRKLILPDLVRAFRGARERRQIDPNGPLSDLVQAQQTLATSVTSYLQTLGQLWTSAVQVADFLQTDDLFQLADPRAIPNLPDLGQLPPLPCCHPGTNPPAVDSTKPRPQPSLPKPMSGPVPMSRNEVKP